MRSVTFNIFTVKRISANRDNKYICVVCEKKLLSKGHWYQIQNSYKQGWATSKKYIPHFVDYTCSKLCADMFILREV